MKITIYIKKCIPIKLRRILKNHLFLKRYGYTPPPWYTDMSGYELLLDTILDLKIYKLDGDFVEIGAFLGGGTYKISMLLEKIGVNKKLFVVDIFNYKYDNTCCTKGIKMSEIYEKKLKGINQYDIYKNITKKCKNIVTIVKDSKEVSLPCKKISFAYIDGNHSRDYVKNDFYLVWDKLVSNGIIAFDDYGYDLPQVTSAIHELIGEKCDEILKIWTSGLKTIFIKKI